MNGLPHTVATRGRTFTVVDSSPLRTDAIVVAKVVGAGARSRLVEVRSLTPATTAHISSDGWIVICGDPALACPDLATVAHDFSFELLTTSSARTASVVTVAAGSTLPFVAPDVDVPAPPIALAGMVLARAFPNGPIANATVTVSGPHPAGALLGLRSDLTVGHPLGCTVRARALTSGAAFTVAEDARSGSDHLGLSSVAGLAPGSLLSLGGGTVATVAVVDAVASRVALRLPTRRTLRTGDSITEVTLSAPTATSTLARASLAGDGVLVTAAVVTGNAVEVVDPDPDRTEVREVGAITDSNGRYRIAGVRNIDAVNLEFAATGFTTLGPQSYPLNPRLDPTVIDASLAV